MKRHITAATIAVACVVLWTAARDRVTDGANHRVWILNRETLQVLARFGQQGLFGGSLNVPHAIAVDSRGNIYVGENFDARRFQRFLFKGVGTPKAGTNPPTTIVRGQSTEIAEGTAEHGATEKRRLNNHSVAPFLRVDPLSPPPPLP